MRNILSLVVSICISTGSLYAQSGVHEYNFKGDFEELRGRGPELVPLCTGSFGEKTLADYSVTRTVYNFDENCGFYYDDSLAGFIANGSYTIELYFSMAALNSWKRVIDFKSRAVDQGCYVYDGQLNFYNIATSASDAPFSPDVFSHYVITRDSATKRVTMYGNGSMFIEFIDNGDDAVYDQSGKLRFFQDDLRVPNEASAGSVALLRIYNYAQDSVAVKGAYNVLSSTLLSVGGATVASEVISISPNPVRDVAVFTLPGAGAYQYVISDVSGRVLKQGRISSVENRLDLRALPEGVYMIRMQNDQGISVARRLVRY